MQRSCREGYKHLRSAGETGEKCGLKNREKSRRSLREESAEPTRRRKTFEKCGGMKPREVTDEVRREVQAKPARSVGEADGMVSKHLNNYFSTTSRCLATLLVAKRHFARI